MSNRCQFHLSAIVNITLIAGALVASALLIPQPAFAGIGFQPVNPEELKMTQEPLAPGAPAIILYRQVDRDDNGRTSHEDNYYRIKILTDEGVKYANIEIPFFKERGNNVAAIHARSIRPDGTIAEFDGKIFEKTIVKARGLKYLAKTLTLPDVKVGSIVEYGYTYDFQEYSLFESHWILSDELFTKSARFSLKPFVSGAYDPNYRISWSWQQLPPGAMPKQGPDGIVRMEATNIPAFPTEDFMPPENELKARVDFLYSDDAVEKDAESFWRKVGKQRNANLESFIGKRKAMEDEVAKIVAPADTPEVKLRKIYDRVQQIRNTSYEIEKTEQEQKRQKEKPATNVEEVLKRGYGDGMQLTWLYLALVRAAGFDAYGCWVSDRSNYFFNPAILQKRRLNANVVLVKLNGRDSYFDPGAEFTPFGLLTWSETGVSGMRLDNDGGSWIQTTLPQPSESQIHREAKLKLSDTGDIEGVVTVTYTGLEAMYHRLEERHEDETARKKYLEDLEKDQIPAASELDLTNKPDWSSAETPLVAVLNLKIPGWASSAGKRAMLPVGFFTAHEKRIFEHANRVHPIYFEYPYEKIDDVTVELPSGWLVSSVPPPQSKDGHVIVYELKAESGKGSVHIVRKLDFDVLLLEPKYYTALRNFFQVVRTGDEQQILIQPSAQSASN